MSRIPRSRPALTGSSAKRADSSQGSWLDPIEPSHAHDRGGQRCHPSAYHEELFGIGAGSGRFLNQKPIEQLQDHKPDGEGEQGTRHQRGSKGDVCGPGRENNFIIASLLWSELGGIVGTHDAPPGGSFQ